MNNDQSIPRDWTDDLFSKLLFYKLITTFPVMFFMLFMGAMGGYMGMSIEMLAVPMALWAYLYSMVVYEFYSFSEAVS